MSRYHVYFGFVLGTFATVQAQAANVDTNPPVITNNAIDSGLYNIIDNVLPESKAVNAEFLNTDYSPSLTLSEDANVYVSFLEEGAGYRNTLGYFTYTDQTFLGLSKADIDTDRSGIISLSELSNLSGFSYGYLFPNLSAAGSGGNLITGDTVRISNGPLSAGTNLSFFLGQNTYLNRNYISDGVLTGADQIFYGLDFLNPEADSSYNIDSSSATSRHVAMLFADNNKDQVIMGFEDLNRANSKANDFNYPSDEDFNDALFVIKSDPATAFQNANIATAPLSPLSSSLLGFGFIAGIFSIANKFSRKCKNHEAKTN